MNQPASAPETAHQTPHKGGWKKKAFWVFALAFIGIQFIPVDRTNPPVAGDLVAPEEVKAILKRACYDCHSNETRWPWYGYIAPGSWLMARDIHEGREYVNFSDWGADYYDEDDDMTPDMFLDTCWESIDTGEMPLWFYIPLHPEAKLTDQDLTTLRQWCGAVDESEKVTVVTEESEDSTSEGEMTEETETPEQTATPTEPAPAPTEPAPTATETPAATEADTAPAAVTQ